MLLTSEGKIWSCQQKDPKPDLWPLLPRDIKIEISNLRNTVPVNQGYCSHFCNSWLFFPLAFFFLFSVVYAYSRNLTLSGFLFVVGTEVLAGFSLKLIASTFTSRYLPQELGWMKEWSNNSMGWRGLSLVMQMLFAPGLKLLKAYRSSALALVFCKKWIQ